MPHRSRSSSAPRMRGLRPWPSLCELRERFKVLDLVWGYEGHTPDVVSSFVAPYPRHKQPPRRSPGTKRPLLTLWRLERQVKNKKIWVKSCHLGLFYFQSLSLYKPISCRAAPGRYIVGFGISFLDMGAGEQSRGGVDVRLPVSQLAERGGPGSPSEDHVT